MDELSFIRSFLEENSPYALERFRSRQLLTVTHKRDANDLLTEVDLTLQRRAVEQIRARFPGDQILAEEGEFNRMPSNPLGRCWVMDPIDGTNNFVRGHYPIFGIALAFTEGGLAQAAGVSLPGSDTLLLARRDGGATCNGARARVSEVRDAGLARVDVDFSTRIDRRDILPRLGGLLEGAGQIRCHGSAVASICMIAMGEAEGYVHLGLNAWDYAAAQLIVEEAGGRATRLDGRPLQVFDGGRGVLISNGAVHAALLQLIA